MAVVIIRPGGGTNPPPPPPPPIITPPPPPVIITPPPPPPVIITPAVIQNVVYNILNVNNYITNLIIERVQANVNPLLDNLALLSWRQIRDEQAALMNLENGITDDFHDETGMDLTNSNNANWQAGSAGPPPTPGAIAASMLGLDALTYLMLLGNDLTDSAPVPWTASLVNHGVTIDTSLHKVGYTGSMHFDGASYLTLPHSGEWNFGASDFAVDCWYYPTAIPAADWSGIMSYFSTSPYQGWLVSHMANNGIGFLAGNPGGGWGVVMGTTATLQLNQWNHLAAIRHDGSVRLFLNGTQQAVSGDNGSNFTSPSAVLALGVNLEGNHFITGKICGARITQRALYQTNKPSWNNFTPCNLYGTNAGFTLISAAFPALTPPTTVRLLLLVEETDTITLNTDLLAYASCAGTPSWTAITLTDLGAVENGWHLVVGSVTPGGSGLSMRYQVTTPTAKNLTLHGACLLWG